MTQVYLGQDAAPHSPLKSGVGLPLATPITYTSRLSQSTTSFPKSVNSTSACTTRRDGSTSREGKGGTRPQFNNNCCIGACMVCIIVMCSPMVFVKGIVTVLLFPFGSNMYMQTYIHTPVICVSLFMLYRERWCIRVPKSTEGARFDGAHKPKGALFVVSLRTTATLEQQSRFRGTHIAIMMQDVSTRRSLSTAEYKVSCTLQLSCIILNYHCICCSEMALLFI